MNNNNRFIEVYSENSTMSMMGSGKHIILFDRETGVQYLVWKTDYACGITPLLGHDGKPVISNDHEQ